MENLDFLNLNSLRSFPVKEGVSCVSNNGMFTIPPDFMVDLLLTVTATVDVRFYISEIVNLAESVTVKISDSNGVAAGFFFIPTAEHTLYKNYTFSPTQNYTGSGGRLTVAYLKTIKTLPTGTASFSLASSELESRVTIPCTAGISKITAIDELGNNFSLTGEVTLVARSNLRFRQSGNSIFLDAGNGLGLNVDCTNNSPNITTINGVGPDGNGNITLTGADCGQFTATTNGLILDDSCTKPCLGCDEIGTLTLRANTLESDILTLRKYFDDLNGLVAQVDAAINYNCVLPA